MPLPLVTCLMERTTIMPRSNTPLAMMSTTPTVSLRSVSVVPSSPSSSHHLRRCLHGGVATDLWLSTILLGLSPGRTHTTSPQVLSTLSIHHLTISTMPGLTWVSLILRKMTSPIQYRAPELATVLSTSHCRNQQEPKGSFFID